MGRSQQLVEGRVQSTEKLFWDPRGKSDGPVEQDRHRVALIVDHRRGFGARRANGDGTRERAIDGTPHDARLFRIDANGALGAPDVEISMKQVTEGERTEGLSSWPYCRNGPETGQRAQGQAQAEVSERLRGDSARTVASRRLRENRARLPRERKTVCDGDVVGERTPHAAE
jgi:hypothetical protein